MTAPYKKRADTWSRDKKESNKAERAYEPTDIEDQLAEESALAPAVKKKKPSKKEKELKSHISNLKWAIKWARNGSLDELKKSGGLGGIFDSHRQRLYQDAKKAIPILREEVNNPDLPSKLKKHIKELLDKVKEEV
jgi:hypothetical protein